MRYISSCFFSKIFQSDSNPANRVEGKTIDFSLYRIRRLGKYYMIAVDATGTVSFDERHCPHYLTKKSKNGKITYYLYREGNGKHLSPSLFLWQMIVILFSTVCRLHCYFLRCLLIPTLTQPFLRFYSFLSILSFCNQQK